MLNRKEGRKQGQRDDECKEGKQNKCLQYYRETKNKNKKE
jgi:hypothetical protein